MKRTKTRLAYCRLNKKVKKLLDRVEVMREESYKMEIIAKMGAYQWKDPELDKSPPSCLKIVNPFMPVFIKPYMVHGGFYIN